MSSNSSQAIGLSSACLAILVSILWGGNVVSIRVGVDSVPPLWSAFWRMFVGVVFVSLWALRQRVSLRPAPGELRPLLVLGAMFTLQIALLNSASPLTSPAYGVVILNGFAIFTNIAGHIAAHYSNGAIAEEPITPVRALGLALAVAGIAWLAVGRPDAALAPRPLLGNLLMVSSAAILGIRQVYTRWLVQTVDPVRSVLWQMLVSVPLFLAIACVTEPMVLGRLTWQAVAAISYQGAVVAGFCFIVWTNLLRKHSAGTLSMFSFLVPICGIALSAKIFGEAVQPSLLAATALVLSGVFVVVRLGQTTAAADVPLPAVPDPAPRR
ncbi:MAG: DMT family transporter [Bryobacteraceae bacterium]